MDIHRATNAEHNSQSSEKIGKTENLNSRNLNTQMVRQPRFVPLLKGEVRTGDKERMTAFGSCVVKETFSSLALSDLLCPKFELANRSIGMNGSCHFAHGHTTYVSGKDTQAPSLK
ncbi:hypothetical protein L1887_60350 [Cichorium endivia]|nr:hypothetical protein L1887_60350 [Cichorium endivia]